MDKLQRAASLVQAFLARYHHFHLETAHELLSFNDREDGAYAARLVAAKYAKDAARQRV